MASRATQASQNSKISSNIKASLLEGLYRARKNIERNKDIYVDAEHELLCEYYRKYQELSKQFQNDKIKIVQVSTVPDTVQLYIKKLG